MHWFYGIKFCKQFNFYRRNVSWNVLDRSDCNLAYFLPIHAPLALDFIITSRCSCQNFSGSYFASTTDTADFLYNCVCVGFLDELVRFKSWFQLRNFWAHFFQMARLLVKFIPKSTTLEQRAISRLLRMRAFKTDFKRLTHFRFSSFHLTGHPSKYTTHGAHYILQAWVQLFLLGLNT
mgnify:CR=1 FL=1